MVIPWSGCLCILFGYWEWILVSSKQLLTCISGRESGSHHNIVLTATDFCTLILWIIFGLALSNALYPPENACMKLLYSNVQKFVISWENNANFTCAVLEKVESWRFLGNHVLSFLSIYFSPFSVSYLFSIIFATNLCHPYWFFSFSLHLFHLHYCTYRGA